VAEKHEEAAAPGTAGDPRPTRGNKLPEGRGPRRGRGGREDEEAEEGA
jgi:hypothetical protein